MEIPVGRTSAPIGCKQVREPADLAIFGAAPAFTEPLHVGRPNLGSRETFLKLVGDILDRRWLTNNGPLLQRFENRVNEYLGVRHCVAMSNGTIALELAIRALGLAGEVVVPSFTFVAAAHALHWQGIVPVFADIDPATHNLDPDAVRRALTDRTTGILAVHLWGRPADVEQLQAIADEHRLALMFDAAHAFGCSRGGRMIGGFGRAEVLSFHATKFLNTFEGGAVVTDDDALAAELRLMRNFGFSGTDNVICSGTNGKMSEINAAMGLANFEQIADVINTNRSNHSAYRAAFAGLPGVSLIGYDEVEACNYQYVVAEILADCPVSRDEMVDALRAENILARRYFWPGCHRVQPYRTIYPNAGVALPATEAVAERVLVLPTGPAVDAEAIETIAAVMRTRIDAA